MEGSVTVRILLRPPSVGSPWSLVLPPVPLGSLVLRSFFPESEMRKRLRTNLLEDKMVKGLRSFRSLDLKYSGWSSGLSNFSSSRMYMLG